MTMHHAVLYNTAVPTAGSWSKPEALFIYLAEGTLSISGIQSLPTMMLSQTEYFLSRDGTYVQNLLALYQALCTTKARSHHELSGDFCI